MHADSFLHSANVNVNVNNVLCGFSLPLFCNYLSNSSTNRPALRWISETKISSDQKKTYRCRSDMGQLSNDRGLGYHGWHTVHGHGGPQGRTHGIVCQGCSGLSSREILLWRSNVDATSCLIYFICARVKPWGKTGELSRPLKPRPTFFHIYFTSNL